MNPKLQYILIEDSPKVCEGIKLRMDEYPDWVCCGFAHHIEDAKQIIARHQPVLVFLDWALKGGSAFDVLTFIKTIQHYRPYIIFNTGYQSENPEIPQEIINNFKIDKYLVKPLWEHLRIHLAHYLEEAICKQQSLHTTNITLWFTDIYKIRHQIHLQHLICILQHTDNPYHKLLYFTDKKMVTVKLTWEQIHEILNNSGISFFVTNSRWHLVIKKHITKYQRPYVYVSGYAQKLEVVKNKLRVFEQWFENKQH